MLLTPSPTDKNAVPRPARGVQCRSSLLLELLSCRFRDKTKGNILLIGCFPETLPKKLACLEGVNQVVSILMCNQNNQDGNNGLPEVDPRTFDLVVVMDYFEHIGWGPWTIQSLLHLIKPGGFFIALFTNPLGISYYLGRLKTKFFSALTPLRLAVSGPHFFDSFSSLDKINAIFHKFAHPLVYRATYILPPWDSASNRMWSSLTLWVERLGCKSCGYLGDWGQYAIIASCAPENEDELFPLAFAQETDELARLHFQYFQRELDSRQEWLMRHKGYQNLSPTRYGEGVEPAGAVLVLSPHPDDELIGCGGILLQLRERGHQITILQLTDGGASAALNGVEESVRHTARFQEARKVADQLQATLYCWPIVGSTLACTEETVTALWNIVHAHHYVYIFVPFINDSHPDHVTANFILAQVLADHPDFIDSGANVYSYEVWSQVPANHFCSIDDQMSRKCDLLMHYRTGMKAVNYVYLCRLNNAYHARVLLGHGHYAEAFLKLQVTDYQQMVALHAVHNGVTTS